MRLCSEENTHIITQSLEKRLEYLRSRYTQLQSEGLSKIDSIIFEELINITEETLFKTQILDCYNDPIGSMQNHSNLIHSINESSSAKIKDGIQQHYFHCNYDKCLKVYTSIQGLKYHKKYGHKNKEIVTRPFFCPVDGCVKTYKNSNGLQYHMRRNHKDLM